MINLNTINQIPEKTRPITTDNKYCCQCADPSGIQFKAALEIIPLPKSPLIPIKYCAVANDAAKTECTANITGAINKNVNSIGSVIPANIAVKVTGIINPNTSFFLFSFAVA